MKKVFMAALHNRFEHYIFPCGFFFLLFSSPNLSRHTLDVCHTSTHGVALVPIKDAGLKRAARGSLKIQDAIKKPEIRHLGIIAQLCLAISLKLRHILTIRKKLVKWQYLLQMSSQYGELGPLAAEIDPEMCGTPANFSGFHVLAVLLLGTPAVGVSQT